MPSANPHVHNHQPSRHKGTGLPAAGLAPWEEKRLLLRFFLVCAGFLRRSWYGAALLFRANRRPFSRRRRLGSPRSSRAGGLPVPAHGLGMVLFRTLTGCIRDTEVALSAGLSLLGGLSLLRFGQGALQRPPRSIRYCTSKYRRVASNSSSGFGGRSTRQMGHTCLMPNDVSPSTHAA